MACVIMHGSQGSECSTCLQANSRLTPSAVLHRIACHRRHVVLPLLPLEGPVLSVNASLALSWPPR